MGRYIIRRVLWVVLLLFIVSAVTFVIFYTLPSADPAALRAGKSPSPQLIAQIRHTLGLDKSVPEQYWIYMKKLVLHFDFGYSFQDSQPVRTEILSRLPATISLTIGAVVVWLLVGLPIGVISAIRSRSFFDRVSMGGALLAISAPVYWLGLVGLYLFSNDIGIVKIFDGAGTYTGITDNVGRWFGSLLLPWLVLAASFAAFYARLLRSNLIEVMSEDYIRTARAKGLPERRVIWRHGMRSAITPIVTILGLDIGILLGGAILTEDVFNIPGVGHLAYEGIINADLPVIQGTVLFGAFFIVVANLIVDIGYAFLDPRVRYS
ncbi:MAG: peptide/nickel transport system permease protein [Solirubrobacteraceae bacterium]|jgi:peptide/nickel transport system permease protein|nr:peptide/nickel transport system permease protein [Solirubrobacteraceae bacterium]